MGNELSFSKERSIAYHDNFREIESYTIPHFSSNGGLRPIFKVVLYNGSVDKCEVYVLSFGELSTAREVLTKKSRPFEKKVHIAANGMIFLKHCQNGLILYGIIFQALNIFYYVTLTNIAEVNQKVLKEYGDQSTPKGLAKNFGSRDASVKFTLNKVKQYKDEEQDSRRARCEEDAVGTEPEFHCPIVQGSFLFVTGSHAFLEKTIQSLSPEELEQVRSDIISNRAMYTQEQRDQRLGFISRALQASIRSHENASKSSSSSSSTSSVESTMTQHPAQEHSQDMAKNAMDVDEDDSASVLSIVAEDKFDANWYWAWITSGQESTASSAFVPGNAGILSQQDEKLDLHKRPSASNQMNEDVGDQYVLNNYFKRQKNILYEPIFENLFEESDNK